MVTVIGFLTQKDLYRQSIFKKKCKYENVIKMKNKTKLALLQTLYLSSEMKKDIKILWDYPFTKRYQLCMFFYLVRKAPTWGVEKLSVDYQQE
jgi:hypothetical protein